MAATRTRQRVSPDGVREQRPFVLVVHRSAALRSTLLRTLDFDGFDVMTTADDEEAVMIVKFVPPHALVVDRRLLNAPPSEFAAEARLATIPIIAFDDAAMMPPFDRCLALGIQPVRWEDGVGRLLDTLREVAVPPARALSRLA